MGWLLGIVLKEEINRVCRINWVAATVICDGYKRTHHGKGHGNGMWVHSWDGHQYFTTEDGRSRIMHTRRGNEPKTISWLRRTICETLKPKPHREKLGVRSLHIKKKNPALNLSIKMVTKAKKTRSQIWGGNPDSIFSWWIFTFWKSPLWRQHQSH